MDQSSSWEANNHSPCQEILPPPYESRKVITVFSRAHHWFLYWARYIQSTPSHPIPLKSSIILCFHRRLCLPSGLFPSGLPTEILYAFLIPHMRATYLTNFILLDSVILITFDEAYKLWNPHYAVSSSLPSLPPC